MDEMFPQGHHDILFCDICLLTPLSESHIFEQGRHPSMMGNAEEFAALAKTALRDKFSLHPSVCPKRAKAYLVLDYQSIRFYPILQEKQPVCGCF
jgi:hypothetical protein